MTPEPPPTGTRMLLYRIALTGLFALPMLYVLLHSRSVHHTSSLMAALELVFIMILSRTLARGLLKAIMRSRQNCHRTLTS